MSMQRRRFIQTSLGASGLAAAGVPLTAARAEQDQASGSSSKPRQHYELRRYRLESKQDRALVDRYWREAAIPAYNRLGIGPIGVFEPADPEENDGRTLEVLLPFESLEQLAAARQKLPEDKQYREAASEYLSTPKKDPAYDRIESALHIAFAGMPQLKVPSQTKQGKDRLFEIRTYESHNEHKARLKVEMFNKHEMALFNSLGFTAVFYGDRVIGDMLPCLTYMLVYDDREQREKQWKSFFESEGWQKLKSMPRYKNTVSKVHNRFLKPTDYSQL